MTPSSLRSSSALRSCFVFVGSRNTTRRKISGAKLGRPVKRTSLRSDKVSPTRNVPWFGMPMISPGSALSAISRSCAKNRIGECIATGLPSPEGVSFMPRLKVPEHNRMNAMRSRCCGSILACTLKMKPVTSFSDGSISPFELGCGRGAGAYLAIAVISSITPNSFSAEPK